jgi:hypothetical protein
MYCCSFDMVDLKELSLIGEKDVHLHIYPLQIRKFFFWCFEHVLLDIVNCNGHISLIGRLSFCICNHFTLDFSI